MWDLHEPQEPEVFLALVDHRIREVESGGCRRRKTCAFGQYSATARVARKDKDYSSGPMWDLHKAIVFIMDNLLF